MGYILIIETGDTEMTKEYEVTLTAQAGGSLTLEVLATSAAEAVKRARDINRREMYFDRHNNGSVSYKARVAGE
jgi:hypothetical protein